MSDIIKCRNLTYRYQNGDSQSQVLNQLNLTVKTGESIAILGQSGCGKSTLLNLLGGMSQPSSGKIELNQTDLSTISEDEITRLRAKYLGFIYQFHHLLKDFSALDNVVLPLLIRGDNKQQAYQQATALLQSVGLSHRLNHKPTQLSGGERQRVAIARALVTKPSCVMADEPTGNLDSKNANDILLLMLSLNQTQQSALVIVTHDEKIAQQMQRILILKDGVLNEA